MFASGSPMSSTESYNKGTRKGTGRSKTGSLSFLDDPEWQGVSFFGVALLTAES